MHIKFLKLPTSPRRLSRVVLLNFPQLKVSYPAYKCWMGDNRNAPIFRSWNGVW